MLTCGGVAAKMQWQFGTISPGCGSFVMKYEGEIYVTNFLRMSLPPFFIFSLIPNCNFL